MHKSQSLFPRWGIRSLQLIILIAPLPFGFSSPLLFPVLGLILITWIVAVRPWATAPAAIPGETGLRSLAVMGVGLTVFQLVPLPRAWLEVISPVTVSVLDSLPIERINWHGISLAPGRTVLCASFLLVTAILFFTLIRIPFAHKDIHRIAMALGASATLQVVIGGGRMLLPGDRFFWIFYPVENPLTRSLMMGTFATNTQAALFLAIAGMVMAGVLAAAAGLFGPRGTGPANNRDWIAILIRGRVAALFMLACLAGFTLTRCVGARWMLIVAGVVFFLGWFYVKFPSHQRSRLRWILIAAMVLTAVAAVQRAGPRLKRARTGSSTAVRYQEPMREMAADFAILGAGAGSFGDLYPLYDESLRVHMSHAPNDWRQTGIETGYLGLGLLICFVLLYTRGVARMWNNRRDPRARAMGAGWVSAATLTPGFAFFHYPFRVPALVFIATIVMAMAVRSMTRVEKEMPRAE